MKCIKIAVLRSELLSSIKYVIKRTKDKNQKILLKQLCEDIKIQFSKSKDPNVLLDYLKQLEARLYSKKDFCGDYASSVVSSMLKKTSIDLESMVTTYVGVKRKEVLEEAETSIITGELYLKLKSTMRWQRYYDFIDVTNVYVENLAFYPMFIRIVRRDKESLLSDFNVDDKYVYSIAYNPDEEDNTFCNNYYLIKITKETAYKLELNKFNLEECKSLSSIENPIIIQIKEYSENRIDLVKIR